VGSRLHAPATTPAICLAPLITDAPFLVVAGSLWIMVSLSENTMSAPELMNLQMQR